MKKRGVLLGVSASLIAVSALFRWQCRQVASELDGSFLVRFITPRYPSLPPNILLLIDEDVFVSAYLRQPTIDMFDGSNEERERANCALLINVEYRSIEESDYLTMFDEDSEFIVRIPVNDIICSHVEEINFVNRFENGNTAWSAVIRHKGGELVMCSDGSMEGDPMVSAKAPLPFDNH